MNETYLMSLGLHVWFAKALFVLLGVHLVLVFVGDTSKFAYIKRLMYFLPTYYLFMAFVFFTGILNLAILHFGLSLSVVLMMVCWVLLIPLGAIGFKRLKQVRISKEFGAFKRFMLVKICIELVLVGAATIFGVMF